MSAERDDRPIYSVMPQHLATVFDRFGPDVARLIDDVFQDVMKVGADRNPVELQNDALSLQAEVLALGVLVFASRLSAEKDQPLARTVETALADIVSRARLKIELLAAAGEARGATRQ